jgi:hypothetical protein
MLYDNYLLIFYLMSNKLHPSRLTLLSGLVIHEHETTAVSMTFVHVSIHLEMKSVPGRGRKIFSSPLCPNLLWVPTSLLFNGYQG